MDQERKQPQRQRPELDLDFPPVDYATWRRRLEDELGEAGFESLLWRRDGLAIEPLYAERPDAPLPALPPHLRGARAAGRWRIASEIAHPSVATAAEQLAADRALDVELFWLHFDQAFRAGRGPERARDLVGCGGVAATRLADLERLLDAAGLPDAAVVLDAGANALPAAALLAAWASRRGVDPGELRGAVGCDPLGALAADGALPDTLDQAFRQMADLAAWTAERAPGLASVLVSATPYHDAGATAVQELAFAAATGIEYLRQLTAAGLGVGAAASRMLFAFSVGSDLFAEIAKLRAARLLWAKVVAACGGEGSCTMQLHARTSKLAAAARAPRLNLLRGAVQGFAAAAGGADSIAVAPWDEPLGPASSAGRRQAVCAQHLLAEEAHLARVADPGGGSGYVESLTDRLARAAWEELRDLERGGGMARAILDGRVARRVAAAAEARRRAVAEGREKIVGVTDFVHPEGGGEARDAVDLEELRCGVARTLLGRSRPDEELLALSSAVAEGGPACGGWTAAASAAAAAGATSWELAEHLRSGAEPATAPALERRPLAAAFEGAGSDAGEIP
jgi:methylmalonyl-CoA mutase